MSATVITITSGKGGVGKTTTAANLSAALAAQGHKVVAIDADIGLRNLDVVMGLENRIVYDLVDVVEGACRIRQAMIKDKRLEGLFLIPAAQSREKDAVSPQDMVDLTNQLREEFDYIVIDSAAGISPATMAFLYSASEVVVVTTPEITAMTDAYALLKTLHRHHPDSRTWILANRIRRVDEGREVYDRIRSVSEKYLAHRPRPEHRGQLELVVQVVGPGRPGDRLLRPDHRIRHALVVGRHVVPLPGNRPAQA